MSARSWPVLVGLCLLVATAAWAEPDGGTVVVDPRSPRAAIGSFLAVKSKGDYLQAARFLDPAGLGDRKPAEAARRLGAVLDRHLWIDLDLVSPRAEGNLDDGLPPELEQLGTLPGEVGPEPLMLVSTAEGWLFAPSTVGRVDAWYARLENRWLLEHLPPVLLQTGPRELQWWQLLALIALALASWALGALVSRVARGGLLRLTRRTSSTWDDVVVERLGRPATILCALAIAWLAMPLLSLNPPAEAMLVRWLRTGFFIGFFWSLLRAVDVTAAVIAGAAWAKQKPASRSLVPLGARTIKVALVAIAAVAVLSELGYPVASLIAGLGIGGLAVALAAQKTVENLFGAFSLGLDQPFREGDFVRVEDFVGTVEVIGLRSTRFRTLDRTLISIPNGKLAEMRLETFAARDRIRLEATVGLVYSTTSAQMRKVLSGLDQVLRAQPKIWPDAVVVRFKQLASSSLDIEVMAWFLTSDWGEFQLIRQEVLLQFMEAVEQAGTSFAFPTQTLHLVREPKRPPSA